MNSFDLQMIVLRARVMQFVKKNRTPTTAVAIASALDEYPWKVGQAVYKLIERGALNRTLNSDHPLSRLVLNE